MAVTVTVPIERLQDPAVAEALSRLMLALVPSERRPRGTRVGAESTPARPAPAPRKRSRSRKPRAKAQGFEEFVGGLPAPSQRFLQVLEARGTLTISEALAELGLEQPKSLGGITGSIVRWAPQRGVEVPFESGTTPSGERLWRWIGKEGSRK